MGFGPETPGDTHPLVVVSPLDVHREQRRHRRVEVALDGRFLRASGEEGICRLIEASVGSALVRTETQLEVGEQIVLYAEHLGRLEAEVVRDVDGATAVSFLGGLRRRKKHAAVLTWLINRPQVGLEDGRRHVRTPQTNREMVLTLADGTIEPCTVLDLSLSGAAVACARALDVGAHVRLGRTPARVVRIHDDGYGLMFLGDGTGSGLQASPAEASHHQAESEGAGRSGSPEAAVARLAERLRQRVA